MSIYVIYICPDGGPQRAVLVKEGFSATAAVLTILWALWHRMWIVAAIIFFIYICATFVILAEVPWFRSEAAAVINAAVGLLLGIEASTLRGWSLKWAGYVEVGLVKADSLDEAELKYFLSLRKEIVLQSGTSLRAQADKTSDALGLFGKL